MVNVPVDQAAGLRRMMASPPPRIISILSALGNVSGNAPGNAHALHRILANLAASFASDGGKAHIMYAAEYDQDTLKYYGLLNQPSLMDVARTQNPLAHAISTLKNDFTSSWLGTAGEINRELTPQLSEYISILAQSHDIVMVETKLTADHHLPLPLLNDGIIMIQMNQKSAAIKQAYILIKQLHGKQAKQDFGILVHANSTKNANTVFNNIAGVAKRFLGVELEYMGYIPTAEPMLHVQKFGRSVVDAFPTSLIANTYRVLAQRLRSQHAPFAAFDKNPMI